MLFWVGAGYFLFAAVSIAYGLWLTVRQRRSLQTLHALAATQLGPVGGEPREREVGNSGEVRAS
jgi:hypothetical protein